MKRHLHLACLLLAVAVSLICTPARADVVPASTSVTGLVVDKNNQPLPGAKVEIVGQSASAYTDLDGRFNLKCEPGAKEILVTYPKCPDVRKRIKPDMTIRIGRTWRDEPERYQWFAGATVGLGATSIFANDLVGSYGRYDMHGTSAAPTISLMGGRAKDVGWYAKVFMTPGASYEEYDDYNPSHHGYNTVKTSTLGGILGGMVRMGSPNYLCMGIGLASTTLDGIPSYQYRKLNWQIDFGFLFKVSNHIGINWSFNVGINNDFNYVAGSYSNLGVSYFFNK